MKISSKKNKGFTLIELLIVIAIIAILTALILPSISRSRSKARDTKRVSDMSQIQLAIEQFFDRCGQFPVNIYGTTLANNGCPTGIDWSTFISKTPTPSNVVTAQSAYDYQANAARTDYILHAILENQIDSLTDSLPETYRATNLGTAPFVCYTGSANGNKLYDYCVGPK